MKYFFNYICLSNQHSFTAENFLLLMFTYKLRGGGGVLKEKIELKEMHLSKDILNAYIH